MTLSTFLTNVHVPWHALIIAGSSYVVYHFLKAVYNAFFHPLSKFPGPKLAAATRIPVLRMTWSGSIPQHMSSLHNTYGPVVRVTPTELSFNNAQAWKDIYGHRFGGKATFPKDTNHYGPFISGESHIINTNDEDHSRVRRILANSFSDKALKEQEPLLRRWADLLVTKLRELVAESGDKGGEVDMVSYYNFTTFDIMADLTFAEPLNMLEGSEYSPWVKTIFASIKAASRMRVLSELPVVPTLFKFAFGNLATRLQKKHNAYTDERVDRRLAKTPDRPDLWSHILKRKDETEGGLSLKEMYSNASIFMIAGTETTATLLSGVTYLLLSNHDKLDKLVAELRTTFRDEDEITVEALARLKYLHACLEEGLRVYPPVPTGLPRVVPPGGAQICERWIPEGTIVSVHNWATYHSPTNFAHPDSFIPERWLADAPAEFVNDSRAAFQPFSTGPRNCLGKNLAYHEARLLLTKVLWNFDLELVRPEEKWNEQGVFFLWDKRELRVRLKEAVR